MRLEFYREEEYNPYGVSPVVYRETRAKVRVLFHTLSHNSFAKAFQQTEFFSLLDRCIMALGDVELPKGVTRLLY